VVERDDHALLDGQLVEGNDCADAVNDAFSRAVWRRINGAVCRTNGCGFRGSICRRGPARVAFDAAQWWSNGTLERGRSHDPARAGALDRWCDRAGTSPGDRPCCGTTCPSPEVTAPRQPRGSIPIVPP
jgi:hypothetical protein